MKVNSRFAENKELLMTYKELGYDLDFSQDKVW